MARISATPTTDSCPTVLLHLVVGLVEPVPGVEAQGDDGQRTAALSAARLLRPLTDVRVEDHPLRTRGLQPHVTCRWLQWRGTALPDRGAAAQLGLTVGLLAPTYGVRRTMPSVTGHPEGAEMSAGSK